MRAEQVHVIAERAHLSEHDVATVLELAEELTGPQWRDDREAVVALPLTRGEHDGWPVGTRGEAAEQRGADR